MQYDLKGLKRLCESSLIKQLSVDNACDVLVLADMHSEQYLKEKAIQFINDNASAVLTTDGWTQLTEQNPKLITDLYISAANRGTNPSQSKA